MKSLGDIYRDSFDHKNRWYHTVWFYTAMIGMAIYLTPGVLWRHITGKSYVK